MNFIIICIVFVLGGLYGKRVGSELQDKYWKNRMKNRLAAIPPKETCVWQEKRSAGEIAYLKTSCGNTDFFLTAIAVYCTHCGGKIVKKNLNGEIIVHDGAWGWLK